MAWLTHYFKRAEFILAVVIVLLMIIVGLINPAFWSLDNLLSLLRSNIVIGIMALGVLLVLISGGIDVSFPVFAVASAYISIKIALYFGYQGVVGVILLSILMGALFGCINAFFIAKFRFIPLITTLGTAAMVRGFLLAFVGTSMININNMPKNLIEFSRIDIISGTTEAGVHYGLSVIFVIYIVLAILMQLFLKYTLIGRSVYALGGDKTSARRVGVNVPLIIAIVYVLAGALAGLAGILHNSLIWLSNPRDFIGLEMQVIAAVVVGGASISGGSGTVLGAMLGVFLIVMVQNSLLIMHIPTTWQQVVIGFIIIVATAITVYRERHKNVL